MGFSQKNSRRGLVSEINVTPLVDVMLVLLIIFMVTAPMMTQGLEVDLPKTTSKALRQSEKPLTVSVNRAGIISLGGIEMELPQLRQRLMGKSDEEKKQPIYLRADEKVAYGIVAKIMANIKQAGFPRLGMITQPEGKEQ